MSHLILIQDEFSRIAKKDEKKTWNQFFSTMGQVEISNPDPKAKKPKIKITSLRGATPDTPKGKRLQQLYKQWKGSGGADAVKSYAKATLDASETKSLRQQLKEKDKQLKLKDKETNTLRKQLEEKIQKKRQQQQQQVSDNSIKKEEEVDDQYEGQKEQKIKELDVSGVKNNSNYRDTITRIHKNEGKLKNDISFVNDPSPPSQNSLDEVKSSAESINRAIQAVKAKGTNISSVTNSPNTLVYGIKFDDDDSKIKGSKWLRSTDAKKTISSFVGKNVIISEDTKSGSFNIEVPKENRDTVSIKDLLTDDEFLKDARRPGKLVIPVGKTIDNKVKTFDFKDEPHMLVAGGTGSGKSVFMNSMVNSLMATYNPDDVQFAMIDAAKKGKEFKKYDGSKYLSAPVAISEKQAIDTLRNVRKETDRRNEKMLEIEEKSGRSFEDLEDFNAFISKNPDDMTDEEKIAYNKIPEKDRKKIPRMVVIVDEVKDLLNTKQNPNAKITRGIINSILSVSRSAGIQMILATQSPSKSAVAGGLQTNIGAKMIFKLNNDDDAQAVGVKDATSLLNHGDGYLITDSQDTRLQSPYISGDESKQFATNSQGKSNYSLTAAKPQPIKIPEQDLTESAVTAPESVSSTNSFSSNIDSLKQRLIDQRKRIREALAAAEKRNQEIQRRQEQMTEKEQDINDVQNTNENLQSQRQTKSEFEPTETIFEPENEPELVSEVNEPEVNEPEVNEPEVNEPESPDKNLKSQIDKLTAPVSRDKVLKDQKIRENNEIQSTKTKKDDFRQRLKKWFQKKKNEK